MIRVKVLSIRSVIRKFLIWISLAIISIYTILLLGKSIKLESRTFAYNIVEKNLNLYLEARDEIKSKILFTELGLKNYSNDYKENLGDKQSEEIVVENIQEEKINIPSKENIDEGIKELGKYVENNSIKAWERPKKFTVSELPSGKIQVGNTYISNYSKLKLNYDELEKVSNFKIDNDTNILIVHTHTSEAYSEVGESNNFRTLDDSKNIVSVGNVLKENLILKRFNVKHSMQKHDTPSYNGAYKACLATVESELKKQKYDIVLDVHRDALSGNLNFRPTAEINGESAAKLMFVVGTNASGVLHDNWMENLKLALLIQNTANEMYPGLFRDLNLSKSRYNQHVSNGALILEVGATGNTLDEVWTAMKYFSNVLQALKEK